MADTKFDCVNQVEVPSDKIYGLSDVVEYTKKEMERANVYMETHCTHPLGNGYMRGHRDAMAMIFFAVRAWIAENEKYGNDEV